MVEVLACLRTASHGPDAVQLTVATLFVLLFLSLERCIVQAAEQQQHSLRASQLHLVLQSVWQLWFRLMSQMWRRPCQPDDSDSWHLSHLGIGINRIDIHLSILLSCLPPRHLHLRCVRSGSRLQQCLRCEGYASHRVTSLHTLCRENCCGEA